MRYSKGNYSRADLVGSNICIVNRISQELNPREETRWKSLIKVYKEQIFQFPVELLQQLDITSANPRCTT